MEFDALINSIHSRIIVGDSFYIGSVERILFIQGDFHFEVDLEI